MDDVLDFSAGGRVLSSSERIQLAKHKGRCLTCGIQLAARGNKLRKDRLTNENVWNGICIRCNKNAVPSEVWEKWDKKNRPISTTDLSSHSNGLSSSSRHKTVRHRTIYLPKSSRRKVAESWAKIKPHLDRVGLDFFLTVFKKYPNLLQLFPFRDEKDLPNNRSLLNHAKMVMSIVGENVVGMKDAESLVSKLRLLGQTHEVIGVLPEYYDLLFVELVAAIKRELGAEEWSVDLEEAWSLVYESITSVMKQPTMRLEIEPLEGWGLAMTTASLWFCVSTPYRLAGFSQQVPIMEMAFDFMDVFAAMLFLIDLSSESIVRALTLRAKRDSSDINPIRLKIRKSLFPLKFFLNRIVRHVHFERWANWPTCDLVVLCSFPLQHIYFLITGGHPNCDGFPLEDFYYFFTSGGDPNCAGIHWSAAFGLLRLFAIGRVVHSIRCVETIAWRRHMVHKQNTVSLVKLAALVCFLCHLFASLYCIIARIGLGEGTVQPRATNFAPDLEVFLSGEFVRAYLKAIHWFIVSMAGIGSVESKPESTLEILFTITTHLIGASLYAFMSACLYSLIQVNLKESNDSSSIVASLVEFMDNCDVPQKTQDRIVSAYIMGRDIKSSRELSRGTSDTKDIIVDMPLNVSGRLAPHLKQELEVYARMKALRVKSLPNASEDFVHGLAESLTGTTTLLPGDYLFQKGEKVQRRVIMVERGTMEITLDGVPISDPNLEPGSVIGKGWLSQSNFELNEASSHKLYMDYLNSDGTARVSIRAMTACRLATGLSDAGAIAEFRRKYKQEIMKLLPQATVKEREHAEVAWSHLKAAVHTTSAMRSSGAMRSNGVMRSNGHHPSAPLSKAFSTVT